MNSPEKCKNLLGNRLLDLDLGLVLTPEDFRAMKRMSCGCDVDLAGYIMWLEEIGAFKTRKIDRKNIPGTF